MLQANAAAPRGITAEGCGGIQPPSIADGILAADIQMMTRKHSESVRTELIG